MNRLTKSLLVGCLAVWMASCTDGRTDSGILEPDGIDGPRPTSAAAKPLAITVPSGDELCADLTTSGAGPEECIGDDGGGTPASAYFIQLDPDRAQGSGVLRSFVRISGNTDETQGVNTSGRPLPLDENKSPTFTHDLGLNEVPLVLCPGETDYIDPDLCYEFTLDINEDSGGENEFLSLDDLKLYLLPEGSQGFDKNDLDATFPNIVPGTWDPVYFLDDGFNNWVHMNYDLESGSGQGDVRMYIPDELVDETARDACPYDQGLGGSCGYWVALWSYFGATVPQSDGYEEWANRVIPVLNVEKTLSSQANPVYVWDVEKTGTPDWHLFTGETGESQYTITATKTQDGYDNWQVTATITITNPADAERDATVMQVIDPTFGGDITEYCDDEDLILSPGESMTCTVSNGVDAGEEITNTVYVVLDDPDFIELQPVAVYSASATINTGGTPDEIVEPAINGTATVVDSYEGAPGDPWVITEGGQVAQYTRTFTCDGDAGTHENTATLTDALGNVYTDKGWVKVYCYTPSVTKTADGYFKTYYDWDITKTADQSDLTLGPGQTFPVTYTVSVDVFSTVQDDWRVHGTITINNPHPNRAAEITELTDAMNGTSADDISCTGWTGASGDVPALGSVDCTYDFDPVSSPDVNPFSGLENTATATQQLYDFDWEENATANGTVDYDDSATPSFTEEDEIDECVDVTDDQYGYLGYVCAPGGSFEYTVTVGPFPDCTETEVCNVADFVTNDTGATGQDDLCIPVSVPCPSCTLTPGYWKTHNVTFWGGARPDDAWDDVGDFLPYYTPPSGSAELTPFALMGMDGWAKVTDPSTDGTYFDALWTPPAGNFYFNLAFHYLAAELNLLNGAEIVGEGWDALVAARGFFATYTPTSWQGVANEGDMHDWHAKLAAFNEGTAWYQCTPDAITLAFEGIF